MKLKRYSDYIKEEKLILWLSPYNKKDKRNKFYIESDSTKQAVDIFNQEVYKLKLLKGGILLWFGKVTNRWYTGLISAIIIALPF